MSSLRLTFGLAGFLGLGLSTAAVAAPGTTVEAIYPELDALYQDLHQNPELSDQEEKTAGKLAVRLRALGFQVTERVGGFGLVAVLANGPGPTLLVRTDLDGLPVEEKTGLPFASKVRAKDPGGALVPVMHACGHDVHMTVWIGVATLLSRQRDRWSGTLVLMGQPAEEIGEGARRMLADGLFKRFPKPDFAVALHDSAGLPAGKVSVVPGFALANVDSVDLTVFGRGGHGAAPHATIDPIVLGARIVGTLQTLVSRENPPLEPAVVTVGSFHAGTKHNIIADEARLQLTVRSYKDEIRERLLRGIERIARGEAIAAGAPEPKIVISKGTAATYNDPALSSRVESALERTLGKDAVVASPPVMAGEDFSELGRAGVPAVIFWVGAVDGRRLEEKDPAKRPSGLHAATFAPERALTLKTGVTAMVGVATELLAKR